jgi:nucleoside phosphorylase
MNRWLLLFAAEMERDAAFREGLPDDLASGITGVGLVDAAIGTTRLIAEHRPDVMIFLGTCGAYPRSGISVGDIIVAGEARIGSGDVAHGAMRVPKLLPSSVKSDRELSKTIVDLASIRGPQMHARLGSVSSTLGITETDGLARLLGEHDGSDVENLEAFPVLRAAGGIPTAIVLIVTNFVGAGGGKEWGANYARMMPQVGTLVAQASNVIRR